MVILRKTFNKTMIKILYSLKLNILFRFVINTFKRNYVTILIYHSIGKPINQEKSYLSISIEDFEKQMRYLKENYNLLSLNKATQILLTKGTFPKNSIVITFDDGYKDNFNNALPILNKYDIPATIFLATNFISKNPFYLSWGDIQKMKNKIDFGSHTCSHKILTNLTTKESTKEIINSKKEIEEIIKKKVYSFAYPMGSKENFNDEIKKIVAKSGFLCACSSIHGTNNAKMDLFELKRKFVIERDINLFAYNLLF